MRTAVIITGTICSGKTTISKKISEELGLRLLSEGNQITKTLLDIIEVIKSNKFSENVLIEHTEILNFIKDINDYFDKKILILLNISDEILINNLYIRKSLNILGDYLNVDIFEMKNNIEKEFMKVANIDITYVANINQISDYDVQYKKIISFICSHLCKV